MKNQTIVIALSLNETLTPLYEWGKDFDFSHVTRIHFIHVVKMNLTPFEYGILENPDDETFQVMKPALNQFLQDESKKIIPQNFQKLVIVDVTKSYDPDQEVVDFLNRVKADLIVVTTKGRHGLEGFFHHSFTNHMIKFAPCDVFVVRPETGNVYKRSA